MANVTDAYEERSRRQDAADRTRRAIAPRVQGVATCIVPVLLEFEE